MARPRRRGSRRCAPPELRLAYGARARPLGRAILSLLPPPQPPGESCPACRSSAGCLACRRWAHLLREGDSAAYRRLVTRAICAVAPAGAAPPPPRYTPGNAGHSQAKLVRETIKSIMTDRPGTTNNVLCIGCCQVATSHRKQNSIEGEKLGLFNQEGSLYKLESDVGKKQKELSVQMESTQLKIEDIKSRRTALLSEINKSKQILEQETNIIAGFPAALQQMDMKSLEEEYKALQGDKAEEIEYFRSLDEAIKGMKSISDLVKCPCGLEYMVELGGEGMDIS